MSEFSGQSEVINENELDRVEKVMQMWRSRLESKSDCEMKKTYSMVKDDLGRSCRMVQIDYRNQIQNADVVLIIAYGENSELLGVKNLFIRDPKENQVWVTGNVEIVQRSKGVASLLEGYAQNYLYEKSGSERKNEYVYLVEDVNRRRLDELSYGVEKGFGDINVSRAYEQATKERKAWEHMYSEKGKYGYFRDGGGLKKVFDPEKVQKYVEITKENVEVDPVDILTKFIDGVEKMRDSGLK